MVELQYTSAEFTRINDHKVRPVAHCKLRFMLFSAFFFYRACLVTVNKKYLPIYFNCRLLWPERRWFLLTLQFLYLCVQRVHLLLPRQSLARLSTPQSKAQCVWLPTQVRGWNDCAHHQLPAAGDLWQRRMSDYSWRRHCWDSCQVPAEASFHR